uniref:Uncharacterized protein LOC114340798 n=1 Tax=Diabrotica virgifera virgifera TaxID=50390 RepID=A0A6P7GQ92_DIAVI
MIRIIDRRVNKPLQWSVTPLHANELPLRYFLQKLDDHTKGPYSYSEPIGSLLPNCEKMPVIKFKPIEAVLRLANENDPRLEYGARHLWKLMQAARYFLNTVSLIPIDKFVQDNA